MNWDYMQPVKIYFGKGRISEIKNIVQKNNGHKGILVATPFFLKNNIAIITEKIADIKTAPAAISFAIFAIILYSFLQMSTTLSIALLMISDTITKAPVNNKIAYFSIFKLKNIEKNIT